MTLDELLDEIVAISDLDDLRKLRQAINAHAEAIHKARRQQAVTDRWTRLERCKPGTTLYCCMSGIGIGSLLQRGDSVKVVEVDQQRERLYVKLHRVNGKLCRSLDQYALSPAECNRYALDRDKPAEPLDADRRKMGSELAKIFGGE